MKVETGDKVILNTIWWRDNGGSYYRETQHEVIGLDFGKGNDQRVVVICENHPEAVKNCSNVPPFSEHVYSVSEILKLISKGGTQLELFT